MGSLGEHTPVLVEEAITALQVRPDGRYVDCTFGRGGHSRAVLEQLGPVGQLLALDRDPEAVATGDKLANKDGRFGIVKSPFSGLETVAGEWLEGELAHGVLFDLGVSSPQLDEARRGFSFQEDGPLDMRMDPDSGESAAEWLNKVSEKELADVLRNYGEERYARRIARAVVAERACRAVDTTMTLVDIIKRASPGRERNKHPATRTFQALRIHINDELGELERALRAATDILCEGGRLVVISFHSLEDRLVKRFMRAEANPDTGPFPVPLPGTAPRLRVVAKPVRAGAEECGVNPRARSATLRAAERIAS